MEEPSHPEKGAEPKISREAANLRDANGRSHLLQSILVASATIDPEWWDPTTWEIEDSTGWSPIKAATHWERLAEIPSRIYPDLKKVRDREGNTPLHWAVAQNQTSAAKFLMEVGLSPLSQNKEKKTAIDLAKETPEIDPLLIKLLEEEADKRIRAALQRKQPEIQI